MAAERSKFLAVTGLDIAAPTQAIDAECGDQSRRRPKPTTTTTTGKKTFVGHRLTFDCELASNSPRSTTALQIDHACNMQ
jgi:hypothetical protein